MTKLTKIVAIVVSLPLVTLSSSVQAQTAEALGQDLGSFVGGVGGAVGGTAAGTYVGGPYGGAAGGYVGGKFGEELGRDYGGQIGHKAGEYGTEYLNGVNQRNQYNGRTSTLHNSLLDLDVSDDGPAFPPGF
ncbi:hypothetical protein [Crocosphaera chwakensis]|uniref:Glycine zipper domain-containing protein n=1 Tax=Crocosphaera chwakensis CCY0110 TaxID=391612 RepID=A3IXR9_9CHRO|nr:hypothetical protein [Crocosphaera chwakensis]EAZ88722.1 hypothetical protein CY0110_01145 [Crocosphaera chwakensis CCY0110]